MKLLPALFALAGFSFLFQACDEADQQKHQQAPLLRVSENHRFLVKDEEPFFWLGDTGWLLFSKLTREEAGVYLSDRASKSFNVIQVMVLHALRLTNAYGDSALVNGNLAEPLVTPGSDSTDSIAYDYWDHVDYIVDKAAEYGIFIGMVPVWGSNVRSGRVRRDDAGRYAEWLAKRYRDRWNIIWLTGGDVKGSDSLETWSLMGRTIRQNDSTHLISYHPFGRTTSSLWFHQSAWLDFNMFQSGHRRYDQDDTDWGFAQDNYKYVEHDYALRPVKPTLDGEPSYEGIPQGLHDPKEFYWNDADVRRYAYWSVFAGGFGFTYGANSVMQFYKPGDKNPAYGAREYWTDGIKLPGSGQLRHLKKLMESRAFLERIPDSSLIAGVNGVRYDHLVATRGNSYAFIYSYMGNPVPVQMGKLPGKRIKASWFKPIDGSTQEIGEFSNAGTHTFDPPGEPLEGNDWVLILDALE